MKLYFTKERVFAPVRTVNITHINEYSRCISRMGYDTIEIEVTNEELNLLYDFLQRATRYMTIQCIRIHNLAKYTTIRYNSAYAYLPFYLYGIGNITIETENNATISMVYIKSSGIASLNVPSFVNICNTYRVPVEYTDRIEFPVSKCAKSARK